MGGGEGKSGKGRTAVHVRFPSRGVAVERGLGRPQELVKLERDISQASGRAAVLELEIYDQLCSQVP